MDFQILGYLLPEECEEFNAYAGSMNLNSSAVANLLIVRELRLRRLPELEHYQRDHPRAECAKIVGHQSNDRAKRAFTAHAESCGLKPTAAAERLFRAELKEHWLEHCIQQSG
jgi:hypothetical protein